MFALTWRLGIPIITVALQPRTLSGWNGRPFSDTDSCVYFYVDAKDTQRDFKFIILSGGKIKLRTIRQSSQTVCCFFYYREIQVSTLATQRLHNKICLALARQPVLGLHKGAGRDFPVAFVLHQTHRGSALQPPVLQKSLIVCIGTYNSLLTRLEEARHPLWGTCQLLAGFVHTHCTHLGSDTGLNACWSRVHKRTWVWRCRSDASNLVTCRSCCLHRSWAILWWRWSYTTPTAMEGFRSICQRHMQGQKRWPRLNARKHTRTHACTHTHKIKC